MRNIFLPHSHLITEDATVILKWQNLDRLKGSRCFPYTLCCRKGLSERVSPSFYTSEVRVRLITLGMFSLRLEENVKNIAASLQTKSKQFRDTWFDCRAGTISTSVCICQSESLLNWCFIKSHVIQIHIS